MGFDGEVAVIGVGSIGSMTLWRLAAQGRNVHGFDQYGIPNDRGGAGGESRMFRSTSPREPVYVPFAKCALELWRQLERDADRVVLTLNGELVMGPESAPHIANVLQSIRDFQLDHEQLDVSDLALRYPQHRMDEDDMAILDPNAGYIRSELAVLAAVRCATAMGASVHRRARVERIEPDAEGVDIRTSTGNFRFQHAVIATGPWVSQLLPKWGKVVRLKRPIQAWFAVDDPKMYTADRFPIALRPLDDGYYGFPTLDGASIKLGPTGPFKEVVPDPDRLDRMVGLDELEILCAAVRKYLPGLHPDPIRVAGYMDGYTVDNRPIIGQDPSLPSCTILTGFSGLGFKYAPAFGEAAAQLVVGGDSSLDVGPFSPGRQLQHWDES